jgi:hypothetical protein
MNAVLLYLLYYLSQYIAITLHDDQQILCFWKSSIGQILLIEMLGRFCDSKHVALQEWAQATVSY